MRTWLVVSMLAAVAAMGACTQAHEKVIAGTVELSTDLSTKVSPEDTVFIIARKAAAGPPLAVKKLPATAFPLSFVLSEKDVMVGGPFDGEVELTVRIDKDGDASTKLPGDLLGKTQAPVKVGDKSVKVLLDQQL